MARGGVSNNTTGLSKAQRRHLGQEGAHFLDPQTCMHPTATWWSRFCGQSSHALVSTLNEKFGALQTWREGRWTKVHLCMGLWENVWKEVLASRDARVGGSMDGSWPLKADPESHFVQGAGGRERCRAVLCSGALCFRGQSGGDSEPTYLTPEDSAGVIFISTRL